MQLPRFRPGLFAAFMAIGGFFLFLALPEAESETTDIQPGQPKLVVLVIFDQMRGDYLIKWENLFDKEGFGRLQRDGAWYQNCHYPYGWTLTGAGHASLSTGTSPYKHGITGNGWYDRKARANVGAVSSNRYRLVPDPMDAKEKLNGPSPERLKQPTVGESLHKMSQGKAKIVSLSIKDRAAILLAGLRATAVYWYNAARNVVQTSTYYRDTVHPWVAEFNKERPADKYFGKDWNRLRPDLDYVKLSGPDDVKVEGTGVSQGRTFPHAMTGGLAKPGNKFYDAVTHSPYGNELILDLAKRAIDAEKLGQGDTRDMLCLSFSSNDLVGHTWGPDSQEVMDMTLRSDLIMKELLNHLDAKVGKDRYVVIITADHGAGPIPEVAKTQGKDAARVNGSIFTTQAAAHLQATFAPKGEKLPWIEKQAEEWIYFNHATLKQAGVSAEAAEKSLIEWIVKQPGIHSAYGRTALQKGPMEKGSMAEMARLTFHPDCSGDVGVVVKPYHMVGGGSATFKATHGTPHPYDTHVPLVVFGPGVKAGVRQEQVTPLAAAAIMAWGLGVPAPAGAEYPVPEGLLK